MSGLFISHSTLDNEVAKEVTERLAEQGFQSLFLDFDPANGIPAGRNWEQELYAQLRKCRAVVLLCSVHSMSSDWCFAEITHARALGKHLFPVVISPCELRPILRDTQVIDLTHERETGFHRLWRGLREAGLDPTDAFAWDINRPPYPGLMPFLAEDAGIFFGRDDDLRKCLDTLAQMNHYGGDRLLVLMGTSGSGKSSLVRAGVIPRLKQMPNWLVLEPMRPQREPIDQLAHVLSHAFQQLEKPIDHAALSSRLHEVAGECTLAEVTRELKEAAGHTVDAVLLVIDQLEEMVTTSNEDIATQFVTLLKCALTAEQGSLFCLATLRSDYLAALQTQPQWRELTFRDLTLGPMKPEEFAKVISKPAKISGITLEEGLVEKMVRDTGTADALPLLAFTLNRLWRDFGRDGRITMAEYEDRIGGLEGSIRQEAKGVLASLNPTPAQLEDLRRAFRLMVRVNEEGQYVRRIVHWVDLPVSARPLLERFVDARLLVSGQDDKAVSSIEVAKPQIETSTLEVAHEALFRAWDELRHWLDEDRAFLLWRQRVERETTIWQLNPKDQGLLLRGGQLAEAKRWLKERYEEVGESTQTFIRASHAQAQRITWIWRGLGATTVIGLLIASFLAVMWWNQRQETIAQLINSYWNTAIAARDGEQDTHKAAHHFARIVDLTANPTERKSSLVSIGILSGGVVLEGVFQLSAPPEGVATATDQSVAVLWMKKTVDLWELKSGALLASINHQTEVKEALIGINGRIISWGSDSAILLWGADLPVHELRHEDIVLGAIMNEERTQLLSWSKDRTARVWDLASGQETARFVHPEFPIGGKIFGSSPHTVLTWSADAKVRIWRQSSKEPIGAWTNQCVLDEALIGPDANRLLSWCGNHVMLHDLDQGVVSAAWTSPEVVDGALFLPTTPAVATFNEGAGRIRTWSTGDGTATFDPFEHESAISRVWLTPDGKRLVTVGANSRISVWNMEQGVLAAQASHGAGKAVVRALLNNDGTRVLSWGERAGARLWDTGTLMPLSLPLLHTGATMGAAFFDHDQGIITWGDDKLLRIWRRQPSAESTISLSRTAAQQAALAANSGVASSNTESASDLTQAIRRETGLESYEIVDRAGQWILLGLGSEARTVRLGAEKQTVSSPITLDEDIRGGQFEAEAAWATLWGASSVRLWDVASARPLSAVLHSDVLFPEAIKTENGHIFSDPERARIYRWVAPQTPSTTTTVDWLQAISGMRMDDRDELQVLKPVEWCEVMVNSGRQPLPVGCVDRP